MNLLAQATDAGKLAMEAANFAANQSDRWHADAILIICFLAIGALTRWGMKQLDAKDAKIEALGNELGVRSKEWATFAITTSEKLAGIISHNSDVIEANTSLSERKINILDRIEKLQNQPK